MGYSTTIISIEEAKKKIAGKEVIEASEERFFTHPFKFWKEEISSAEIGDNNRIYLNFYNDGFATIQL